MGTQLVMNKTERVRVDRAFYFIGEAKRIFFEMQEHCELVHTKFSTLQEQSFQLCNIVRRSGLFRLNRLNQINLYMRHV